MFSFYIYKNSTFSPNILLVSTIDDINVKIVDTVIDDIISALLENKYLSLKNNIISCIIDRKNERKQFFINRGSDSIKIECKKLDLNYLEKFSFDTITNYKSMYLLEYNKEKSELTLKEKEDDMKFLGNFW